MFQPGDRVRFRGEEHFPMVTNHAPYELTWAEQESYIMDYGWSGVISDITRYYVDVVFDDVGYREGFFAERFELDVPAFEIDKSELEALIL